MYLHQFSVKYRKLPPSKVYTSCKSLFFIVFILLELTINISFLLDVSNSCYCDVSGIDQFFCFGNHIDFDLQGFQRIFSSFLSFYPRKNCILLCSLEKFLVICYCCHSFCDSISKKVFLSHVVYFSLNSDLVCQEQRQCYISSILFLLYNVYLG